LFYGHLVGELIRRVDGRSPGRFLREEVCGPRGLDFQFGLSDADQTRAVEITGLPEYERMQRRQHDGDALYWRALDNPPGSRDASVVNSAAWRAAEIPAINGHGTARGIAGLYAALLDDELLSAALLSEATTAQCSGVDAVMGQEASWGLGFGVDPDGFGMGGLGGSWAGVSTSGGYAFCFVTGTMGDHDRVARVENTFRRCIGLGPID
jgi:CubicO group peptidase (beta-lactamase class C family)